MPQRHRSLLSAVAGAGTAVLAVGLIAAPAQAAPTSIRILTVNDFHGRLVEDEFGGIPGAAKLAGAVTALSADQPTTFVSAGDSIGASPFVSAVQDDAPTIEALNLMGLATSAVGNHEFDRGYDFLADDATHGVTGDGLAQWPTLGANVDGEAAPELPEYEVVDVGGVQVGFVGVVTRQTASLVSPDGIAGITFVDPTGPANDAAALLSDGDDTNGEADVVVLLAHEGAPSETADEASCDALAAGGGGAFGDLVSGASGDIDAIVGGHTHLTVDCDLPHPDGGVRPVIEANSYGTSLGQIDLTVDPDTGEVSAAAGTVVDVLAGGYEADAEVLALVEAAEAEADVVGLQPVGEITADITRAFLPDSDDDDRGAESALGNFIADVQLDATAAEDLGGAQIALMNPGGIRDDFRFTASGDEGDGVVTYAEAATVQPFANGVITMTLTGEQVRQVLEQQWQPADSSRPFLALGLSEGFFYTYDPDAAEGERIVSVTLDGVELDPAADYRVTVNSFLAAGGDNFTVLAEGTDRQDNGFNDLNVLVDYFAANSPVTADVEPRRALAVDAEPTPTPTPTPTTPGTGTNGGSNPGLSVDTGRTGAPAASTTVLAGLLLLVLSGVAVVATATTRGRR